MSFDNWENELCHYGVKGMQWRNKKGAQTFYRFPDGRIINLRSGKKSEPDAMKKLFRQSAGMPTQQKSTGFEVAKNIPQKSAKLKVAKVEQTTNKKEAAPSGKRMAITNLIYQNRKKQMQKSWKHSIKV